MTRLRVKDPHPTIYKQWTNGTLTYDILNVGPFHKEVFYDSVPGPCECLHSKYKTTATTVTFSMNGNQYIEHRADYPITVSMDSIIAAAGGPSMDWNQLPTSSQFNVIEFFAELDGALMNCLKFKFASYAEWQWGVLPFISDIQAMLQAVAALDDSITNFPYENQQSKSFDFWSSDGYWHYVGDVTYRLTGGGNISHTDEAQRWLDRLGFHPDISTMWNLVPFSFVVDWLIPVGSYLDTLIHRGWVDSMGFSGWYTALARGTAQHNSKYPDPITYCYGPAEFEIFQRKLAGQLWLAQPRPEELTLQAPSLRNVCEAFYLFLLVTGKGS